MRPIFLLTPFFFLAQTAFAADLGQYRNGSPYQSVIAEGADICESHCAGDALCRSWNYVKVNPKALGVCEFNSNDVPPVPSAISISGANIGNVHRRNVLRGGVNTVRVGTEVMQSRRPEIQTPSSPPTIIHKDASAVNKPVYASTRPQIATIEQESLTAQQNRNRTEILLSEHAVPRTKMLHSELKTTTMPTMEKRPPQLRFQHDLGDRMIPALPPQKLVKVRAHNTSNVGQYRRHNQGPAKHQRLQEQRVLHPQNLAQPSVIRQQSLRPNSKNDGYQTEQHALTGYNQTKTMPPQQALMRRPASNPAKMGDDQITSESQLGLNLYGKLNDDVIVPSSGEAIPNDPELPISTASSRPTENVEQSYLGDLAGGPS